MAASPELDPGAVLLARVAGFAGFLRANGYSVGGADSSRLLEASLQTGILDQQVLRWSLKALLCGRGDEWRRFDALFDAYFLPPNKSVFVASNVVSTGAQATGEVHEGSENEPAAGAGHGVVDDDDAGAARHGASREESLATTDFRDLSEAEHARAIEALMRRFARRLKHLYLRREERAHRGRRLDLQGTIRNSVACGGTPLRLAWKHRRRVRPRLLVLLDVSRSMSLYSFFYLRLARALCGELADVHCFIFHTRITGVAEALRDPDPWRSQERLHLLAAGWGGGTRIGECLLDFNRDHGARLVHSRTGVIIVSDGYDTGEPELLAQALATLRRRSRRMVWLNPLLNQPGFSPESRGMQAAMPHLDLLAAGADLADIERLLPQIIETLR
ncbi:MAG: VWA domain-containing protein [Gammaproteobacteria bacterium]|nr:VWA domain-containing protein [Gammaproteobacteria bacterium]